MSTEIELKLEIEPDDLPTVRQYPPLARSNSRTVNQVTVYYDTPETLLGKKGFTLRVRSMDGRFVQTVKPTGGGVGLVAREEAECELASAKPDLAPLSGHSIRTLLPAKEAGRLQPTMRSDVTRTSWMIEGMQVDLDHGTISACKHSEQFAELEFELLDGPPASLIVAARRLADHVPVRLGVLTKAERGALIGENKLHRVHKAVPLDVRAGMTIAEAFQAIVHACLKHYRLNEPLVIRKSKVEALHQTRVAMRRLRSAFSLFKPAIEDVEYQHLRHQLRWFTAQLGDARNIDVYLQRDLDEEERARLMPKRESAYDRVVDAMNSHKFRRLLIDLVGWTAMGTWRSSRIAQRSVEGFANRRLDRLWESIASRGRDLAAMDEATRHELRIQSKKMRYAVEFLRGLYPHALAAEKRFADAVAQVQESLGKLNDIATAKTLGSTGLTDSWLIGSLDERRHLIAAEQALRDLESVGSFWRARQQEPA